MKERIKREEKMQVEEENVILEERMSRKDETDKKKVGTARMEIRK
jgi:hypothetical protein